MSFYEILDPYYALIKAKSSKDAVNKYIKDVAGDDSDYDSLLEECHLVPDYYASAKLAQAKDENGKVMDLEEVIRIIQSDETEILLIDGSLI